MACDEQYFWNLKCSAAEVDRQTADVNFVMSFNPRIFMDGDQWCALVGNCIQDGVAGFGKTYLEAVLSLEENLRRHK